MVKFRYWKGSIVLYIIKYPSTVQTYYAIVKFYFDILITILYYNTSKVTLIYYTLGSLIIRALLFNPRYIQ